MKQLPSRLPILSKSFLVPDETKYSLLLILDGVSDMEVRENHISQAVQTTAISHLFMIIQDALLIAHRDCSLINIHSSALIPSQAILRNSHLLLHLSHNLQRIEENLRNPRVQAILSQTVLAVHSSLNENRAPWLCQ